MASQLQGPLRVGSILLSVPQEAPLTLSAVSCSSAVLGKDVTITAGPSCSSTCSRRHVCPTFKKG